MLEEQYLAVTGKTRVGVDPSHAGGVVPSRYR